MEKRSRLSWGRKAIPLKNSTLFNKSKHSEEWHQTIDKTAGVLHPSDSKFPFGCLRNHTDAYLNKKNKISQVDTDIRLAILISAHDAKDLAVAAAAHAMTATRLRALLPADLNVMHGSYFGLKMWLQCLIAANYGNPASVNDEEARWARMLLPFATQGPRAAEWYLVGICRALREVPVCSIDILPEFAILMRRAIADYSIQLEGYRLRCQWAEAYDAVLWMMELAQSSPVITPLGHLLPEHILDSQLPSWRLWAYWKPNKDRLKLLSSCKPETLAIIPEFVSLEGPDMITGAEATLKEGLVAQYAGAKALLRWRGIMVEVPGGHKEGLRSILEKMARALDKLLSAPEAGNHSMFELFKDLIIARPITASNLDILEATFRVKYTPNNDVYNAVREVFNNRDKLGRPHILALEHLMRSFEDENSEHLRIIFLQGWLRQGIENCVRENHQILRMRINQGIPWTDLALEHHAFCTMLKASEHHWPSEHQTMKVHARWPSLDEMKKVVMIYDAAQKQRRNTTQCLDGATRVATPPDLKGGINKTQQYLEEYIEAYCKDRLLEGGNIDHASQEIITAILHVWESTAKPYVDSKRRELALLISNSSNTEFTLRHRCLAEIASGKHMQTPTMFVRDLISILQQSEYELSKAIVTLTNVLVGRNVSSLCWKDLLYTWLERQCHAGFCEDMNILEYSLQTMKATEWLSFVGHVEGLLTDFTLPKLEQRPVIHILRPSLLGWKTEVSRFQSTLLRLEAILDENCDPVRCLLSYDSRSDNLLGILECLKQAENKPVEVLMQKVVGKLSAKAKNDLEIKTCLLNLAMATPETVKSCIKLWDANFGYLYIPGLSGLIPPAEKPALLLQNTVAEVSIACTVASMQTVQSDQDNKKLHPESAPIERRIVPAAVAEVMVMGWIFNDDINESDRLAVVSLAMLFNINIDVYSTSAWSSKLTAAARFWQSVEDEIIREATRLEDLQKALKLKDPKGTRLLLQELGIPSNSVLDDEMMGLPAGILDVVGRVGEDQVEITFPLAAFTELQRKALGIPQGASSVVLRLLIASVEGPPTSFCVHFNNDENLETLSHRPWRCSQDSRMPHEMVCITTKTAFVWQLNRMLHTRIKLGDISIVELHKLVKKKMKQMGQVCISCALSHNAKHTQLRRATPCNLLACVKLWYQLPLDVRVPEIRTDTYAVDAMLTAVYAAAMSGRLELLPDCPIHGSEAVKAILNTLPNLKVLSRVSDVSAELKRCHLDAEKLISWACVHHRGYVATATGICRVSTMPAGTHQFVLANASPRLESNFTAKLPRYNAKTTVLFHGTTFDRLPAILAQGLKVCSGTSLQRTGAAHGKGIYMAEEPATSLTYAPATTSWRSSGLTNMRLLLGCEVVGNGKNVSSGIHVLTDEKSVMVRYIFFLKSHASTPIRNHIVPAMASGMNALRTGAV